MKKSTGKFKQVEETILACDHCGKEIGILEWIIYDAKWSDGYDYFGDKWDFCSLDCLVKEITEDTKHPDFDLYFPRGEDVKLVAPSSVMKIIVSKLL